MPPVIVTETHRKEERAEPHGQKVGEKATPQERVNLAKMKPLLVFLLTVVAALSSKGYAQDTIHTQKLPFTRQGVIILTQDSVIVNRKRKNGMYRLSFSYKEIKSVQRYSYLWALPVLLFFYTPIFDHGIEIKMKNGTDYMFFIFKRKKIIRTIRSKIAN